jgi:hypothetical protein
VVNNRFIEHAETTSWRGRPQIVTQDTGEPRCHHKVFANADPSLITNVIFPHLQTRSWYLACHVGTSGESWQQL